MQYSFKNDSRRTKQNITIDPNKAIEYYKTHSLSDTAKAFGIQHHAMARMFTKLGVKQRSRNEALKLFAWQNRSHIPQETVNWKGGRVADGKGYIRIYQPDHPRAASFNSSPKKRYVLEHILNWEKANKKPVPKGHIVHHLNGIRNDNRPENLVVLPSIKEHKTWTITQVLEKRLRELEAKEVQPLKQHDKIPGKVYKKEYIVIHDPSHPRAMKSAGKPTYVFEHIVNWEKANNKPVPKGAIIHHLNGIKDDNRPENLAMLPSRNDHSSWTIVNLLRNRIKMLEDERRNHS